MRCRSPNSVAIAMAASASLHRRAPHCCLMPAALMTGHHFSMSAFCCATSASGVCCSRGGISMPRPVRRSRTAGSAERLLHRGVELGDDRRGRAGRRPEAVPQRHVQARRAGLVHGRDVADLRDARRRGNRQGLDRARAHMHHRVLHLIDHEIDLAGEEIDHRRRRAAIGHVVHAAAGERSASRTASRCGPVPTPGCPMLTLSGLAFR